MTTVKALTAGILLSLTASVSAHAMTMSEAVSIALDTHPDIKIAEKRKTAIGYQIDQARAGFRPTADITAASGYENSYNTTTDNRPAASFSDDDRDLWRNEVRLTARQMLFDGWSTRSKVVQQKNRFASAHASMLETKELVALRAIEAYMNVLRNQELVKLGRENLSLHQNYLDQITQRTNGGRGSQADIEQANGRTALAKSNLIAFEGELRKAEANFQQIIGENPTALTFTSMQFANLPANLNVALESAMANNPSVRSATADIAAAKAALAEAKSAFCPRFDLEGNVSHGNNLNGIDATNNNANLLVRMSYNLYSGGANTAARKERISVLSEAEDSLARTKRLVRESMEQAWTDFQVAKQRLAPLNQHVSAADKTRTAYREQFDINQRSLLDLLDSEIEVFNSRSALINAKYEVDLSAYEIMANAGMLVNSLQGGLANVAAN